MGQEEEAMSALGPLGGTGGGIGALEKMTTVGKGRRIEEVGGAVEVRTHRWSSGNGGNCKDISRSIAIDVAVHSSTLIASLIGRRKLLCVCRLDQPYVGFEETGVEELQNSCVDALVDALSLGSSS